MRQGQTRSIFRPYSWKGWHLTPKKVNNPDFETLSDIGRAFAIMASLADALSHRGDKSRLPVVNILANSAGVAAMADLSLAAACTHVDPGGGPLFVPAVDPRTWEKPTLHISMHFPVALYLNSHGWRRLQLAFFLHSR